MNTTGSVTLLLRAAQLLDLARPADAKRVVVDVLASDPDNGEAQRLLVRCLIALDDPKVLEIALRAVAADPENEQGHRLLAIAYLRSDDGPAAAAQARIAISLAPFNWQGHYVLTCALTKVDPVAALSAGADGLRVGPNAASMHLAYGEAALACKLTDEAALAFEKVLALDPSNAAARNNLAILDLRKNRFGKAIKGFGSALNADPRLDLARRNIDVVGLAMLLKLRYVMMLTEILLGEAVRYTSDTLLRSAMTAGVVIGWLGLTVVGLARIPKRFRRYVLGIPRRNRRAAVVCAVVAVSFAGVVLGPLTNVVNTSLGLGVGVLLPITVLADLAWYSKRRKGLSTRRRSSGSGL